MSLLTATTGPSAYWYLARATGAVALVLLTVSVVLGVLGSLRFSAAPRWPRFAIDAMHREVSLLVIVLLMLHVVTSVLDGFAPISLIDGMIPFASAYRPLWLGLGTLSFDLLLALVLSSLVRRRLGHGAWRAVHWLAYLCWPVAVLHGLGTGSDVKSWWMLLLTFGCVAAVAIAVLVRIGGGDPTRAAVRAGAMALSVATPIGIATFTLAGPLQHGWARTAGTPPRLLGESTVSRALPASRTITASGPLRRSFTATLSGTMFQEQQPGGAIVELMLRLGGGVSGAMRVRMGGHPLDGGGLSMTGSQVDISAVGMPAALQGRIVSLQGDRFEARVSDGSGAVVRLNANLNIAGGNTVTGSLTGGPVVDGP